MQTSKRTSSWPPLIVYCTAPLSNAYAGGGDGGGSGDGVVVCKENHAAVQAMASDHLKEGYARSKYVAETMCATL